MSGLDDLNSDNPVVRRALRACYGHWIREVGGDGFRIDAATGELAPTGHVAAVPTPVCVKFLAVARG